MRRYPQITFDKLKMYFGEPYIINSENARGSITIYQPTIGNILQMGQTKFYGSASVLVNNTTSYRLPLWKTGIDWNEISDFELFTILYKVIDSQVSRLLFGDVNLTDFQIYKKIKIQDDKEIEIKSLYDEKKDIEINEQVYQNIHQYLQIVLNIIPEEKITHDNIMKKWFIDKDERQLKIDMQKAKKNEQKQYSLQPIISACINHPGFKYKLKELKDVGIFEFFDSVKRLQIYENSTALLKGMYSGFVDSKGIDPESYNFMKEI